jgi:hypothetical protein
MNDEICKQEINPEIEKFSNEVITQLFKMFENREVLEVISLIRNKANFGISKQAENLVNEANERTEKAALYREIAAKI